MKHVKKSVLLWYSPAEMYGLVTDVERYPEFLPWCSGADILELRPDGKVARLHIDFHGVTAHFTTDNVNDPPHSMQMKLKEGPFRTLSGEWMNTPASSQDCTMSARRIFSVRTSSCGLFTPKRLASSPHCTPTTSISACAARAIRSVM